MTWRAIVLALIRCELKARYSHLSGWQVSAKGGIAGHPYSSDGALSLVPQLGLSSDPMQQQPPQLPPTITFVPWANAFTADELDKIQRIGDALPLAEAQLMTDMAADNRDVIRVTRTAWLDSNPENKWVYDRVQQITMMINAMSYRFELTGFSER